MVFRPVFNNSCFKTGRNYSMKNAQYNYFSIGYTYFSVDCLVRYDIAKDIGNLSIIKLAPYSSELNPIEQVWSRLRHNTGATTKVNSTLDSGSDSQMPSTSNHSGKKYKNGS